MHPGRFQGLEMYTDCQMNYFPLKESLNFNTSQAPQNPNLALEVTN